MADDSPELPRLALFPAEHPYGKTTLILNRTGAESLLVMIQNALQHRTAAELFYQKPDTESPDAQQLCIAVSLSDPMNDLISQFNVRKSGSDLGPEAFIRKHCRDESH